MVQGQMLGWLDIGIRINDQATKQLGAIAANLNKTFGKNLDATIPTQWAKEMKSSFDKTGGVVTTFNKTFADGTKAVVSNAKMMRSGLFAQLTDIGGFVQKIAHYIQFSIGVQMVMGIKKGFQDMISTFSDFEKAASAATAVSGYIGASFDKVKKHIMEVSLALSTETVFSANEVIKSFYSLASAGFDVAKVTKEDLIPITDYATATQTDLDSALQSVMQTMKQFNLDFSNATEIVDSFTQAVNISFLTAKGLAEGLAYVGPMAGMLGLSLQETEAALAILTDRGLEASQAGQRLSMILTTLLDPSKEAVETIEGLGLSMTELDPTTHSLVDILYTLQAANFGMAEAATLFRTRTAGTAGTLVEEADSVAMLTGKLEMAEGVTHAVASAQKEDLWYALKQVSNAFTEMAIAGGNQLKPILISLAGILKDTIMPALKATGDIVITLYNVLKPFGGVLKVLVPTLITMMTAYKIFNKVLATNIGLMFIQRKTFLSLYIAMAMQTGMINTYNSGTITATILTIAFRAALETLKSSIIKVGTFLLTTPLGLFITGIGLAVGGILALKAVFDALNRPQKEYNKLLTESQRNIVTIADKYGITADSMEVNNDAMADTFDKLMSKPNEYANEIKYLEKITNQKMSEISKETLDVSSEALALGLYNFSDDVKKGLTDIIVGTKQLQIALDETQKPLVEFNVAFNDVTVTTAKMVIAQKALEDPSKSLTDIMQEQRDAGVLTTETFRILASTWIPTLIDKENNLVDATEIEIQRRETLVDVTNDYNVSLKNLRKTTGSVLQALRTVSTSMDFYIGELENAALAETKLIAKRTDLERITRNVENATTDLAEINATYGAGSREAIAAEDSLNDMLIDKIDIQTEISELELQTIMTSNDRYNSQLLVNKALAGETITIKDIDESTTQLNSTEMELLKLSRDIIIARENWINAEIERMKWQTKADAMEKLRAEGTKFMDEQLLKLYESQNKIFDIEEKLYKLRTGEDEQLEGLFDSLAEQGLINEDIITQYSDLEYAEGKVLGLSYDFAQVTGKLTKEQRPLVAAFMNGTASVEDMESAGITGISTIIAMRDAQNELKTSTDDLSTTMIPQIQNWLDMGLVNQETANQLYDYIDNAYEVADSNIQLTQSQQAVADNFDTVMNLVGQMANALVTGEDGAKSISDVYDELAETLGIGGISFEEIVALTGSSAKSQSELTDEEYILALALKKTAKDLGIYEEGMTGADIASQEQITTATELEDIYTDLRNRVGEITPLLTSYAIAQANANYQDSLAIGFKQDILDTMNNLDDYIGTNIITVETTVDTSQAEEELEDLLYDDYGIVVPVNMDTTTFVSQATGLADEFVAALMRTPNGRILLAYLLGKHIYFGTNPPPITPPPSNNPPNEGLPPPKTFPPTTPTSPENPFRVVSNTELDPANPIFNRLVRSSSGKLKSFSKEVAAYMYPVNKPISWAKGGVTKGSQLSMIGEAGREAVIPLEGVNRKYGRELLEYILPKYYPDLVALQAGGIMGGNSRSITYGGDTNENENYNIMGPINVNGVQNVQEFGDTLKWRMRASR